MTVKLGTKSIVQDEIIKLLKRQGSLRFTEIREYLDISKPVLSYHLGILKNEKSIQFTESGREKHYKLSPNISKKFERKMAIVSGNFNASFEADLDEFHSNLENGFEFIAEELSAIFLYTMIKGMKTGKNWIKAFDSKELAQMVLLYFNSKIFDDEKKIKKLKQILLQKGFEDYFKEINKISNKLEKETINEIFEMLNEKYSGDVKFLEEEAPEKLD